MRIRPGRRLLIPARPNHTHSATESTMTLNLDDLAVTTFATGGEDPGEVDYATIHCPQSWQTNCLRTCVTCNGCETGTAGAC
jgi:hypothetical protein